MSSCCTVTQVHVLRTRTESAPVSATKEARVPDGLLLYSLHWSLMLPVVDTAFFLLEVFLSCRTALACLTVVLSLPRFPMTSVIRHKAPFLVALFTNYSSVSSALEARRQCAVY